MNDKTYSYEFGDRTLGPFTAGEIVQLVCDELIRPDQTITDEEGHQISAGEVCSLPTEKVQASPPPLCQSVKPLPWNPIAVAWLGLVFSPIWAAVMSTVNVRRLGMSLPIWRPVLIAVGLLLLDVLIGLLLFGSVLISLSLFLGALWWIWRTDLRHQLPVYKARSAANQSGPSWLLPTIVGAPCAVVVFLTFIVTPLIPPEPEWVTTYHDGLSLLEAGDFEGAVSTFSAAITLNPKSFEAYNGRGLAHRALSSTAKAICDFDIAVDLAPDEGVVYYNRGLTHGDQGSYDKAIDDFNETIRLCPDDVDAFCHRGIARLQNEEYDQAIADLTRTLELDPDQAVAFNMRGVAYAEKGLFTKAIADFDEALRLEPDFAEARENKSRTEEAKLAATTSAPFRWTAPPMPKFQDPTLPPGATVAAARAGWHAVKDGTSGAKALGRFGKGVLLMLVAIGGAIAAAIRRFVWNDETVYEQGH